MPAGPTPSRCQGARPARPRSRRSRGRAGSARTGTGGRPIPPSANPHSAADPRAPPPVLCAFSCSSPLARTAAGRRFFIRWSHTAPGVAIGKSPDPPPANSGSEPGDSPMSPRRRRAQHRSENLHPGRGARGEKELRAMASVSGGTTEGGREAVRRLRRRADHRAVAGVAGGLADYTGIPVWLIRLGFIVLAFTGGGILLYAIGW